MLINQVAKPLVNDDDDDDYTVPLPRPYICVSASLTIEMIVFPLQRQSVLVVTSFRTAKANQMVPIDYKRIIDLLSPCGMSIESNFCMSLFFQLFGELFQREDVGFEGRLAGLGTCLRQYAALRPLCRDTAAVSASELGHDLFL